VSSDAPTLSASVKSDEGFLELKILVTVSTVVLKRVSGIVLTAWVTLFTDCLNGFTVILMKESICVDQSNELR